MKIVDFHPVMGAYYPGDRVVFSLIIDSASPVDFIAQVTIWYLAEKIIGRNQSLGIESGCHEYLVEMELPSAAPRGYGVKVNLVDEERNHYSSASTAVDVLNQWTERPRYGFLTDFSPDRLDIQETIRSLSRFHINGLQFYDWQYRHDQLLSPEERYADALGRRLSLKTVMEFIDTAHNQGIAAMPYLAVYAASLEFWDQHKDWVLYDAENKPITFEGFLGLMDPSPKSLWIDHLLDECGKLQTGTGFDGFHVDQYGEPKEGFDAQGDVVDIPASFNYFIWLLKKRFPTSIVTFNAVGNWPIDHLARAPLDFLYIEVWPPAVKYLDLLQMIKSARVKSGNKAVVVALYLPARWESNIRLVDALVFASGGSRIEIGERDRLLTDPYFPNHQPISPRLLKTLRRYYDFAVRYGDLIGPQAGDADDVQIELPEGVWGLPRRSGECLAISLVNFSEKKELRWDEEHLTHRPLEEFTVQLSSVSGIKEVYLSSPDGRSLSLVPVNWWQAAGKLTIDLPKLDYWSLLILNCS